VVFHVYKDALGAEHGLIVSLTDLSTSAQWNFNGDVPNCDSPWNGSANTASILAFGSAQGCAAQLCYDYEGGGFTDWYLPAINELSLMNDVQFSLNQSLSQITGAATFGLNNNPFYWSSSQSNSGNAWRFLFNYGYANDTNKYENYFVRAVRAF